MQPGSSKLIKHSKSDRPARARNPEEITVQFSNAYEQGAPIDGGSVHLSNSLNNNTTIVPRTKSEHDTRGARLVIYLSQKSHLLPKPQTVKLTIVLALSRQANLPATYLTHPLGPRLTGFSDVTPTSLAFCAENLRNLLNPRSLAGQEGTLGPFDSPRVHRANAEARTKRRRNEARQIQL